MRIFLIAALALSPLLPHAASAQSLSPQTAPTTLSTTAGQMQVQRMVGDLIVPWAFGFLPDGTILITERDGGLISVGDQGRWQVSGVPEVATIGQGGLLDLLVPRDFSSSREVFFTFAAPQGGQAGTAVARARLSEDGRRLTEWQVIFEMAPGSRGGRHFGSRLVEAPDGTLIFTIGDRGDRPAAQDPRLHNGKTIRITRDGDIPADNPFFGGTEVLPEVYTLGHRNPQGAAVDLQGRVWANEHGARGGDEVNLLRPGRNYGWPVISYGRHYSGARIGEGTAKPGLEQPVAYWDPSIAPSGMVFHTGRSVPQWRGNAFVGSLKFDYIARLGGDPLRELEQLRHPATARVRDLREGPDGALWFLSVGNGALYRLVPGS